jgi:hypothetical protein
MFLQPSASTQAGSDLHTVERVCSLALSDNPLC